jgi:aromatic ring-opening dioxygenase catalytic subunit (LigB family)
MACHDSGRLQINWKKRVRSCRFFLLAMVRLGREALLSIPTPEHYLPLMYTLGLQKQNEKVSFSMKKRLEVHSR